jgi:hypothetical protein
MKANTNEKSNRSIKLDLSFQHLRGLMLNYKCSEHVGSKREIQ